MLPGAFRFGVNPWIPPIMPMVQNFSTAAPGWSFDAAFPSKVSYFLEPVAAVGQTGVVGVVNSPRGQ
jgi:hypothetical protein